MENIDEIEDTGEKGDLDESDQLPVRASGFSAESFCYICNIEFVVLTPKSTPEIYSDDAMLLDKEDRDSIDYYRLILFHPGKDICRISGLSCLIDGDYSFHTRQAPWDEHTAIMRSTNNSCLNNKLATALQYESRHLSGSDRLTCLEVHGRCWQLLCRHRIWSLCGGDIKVVMRALYCRHLHQKKQPFSFKDCFDELLEDDREPDPLYSDRIRFIIRQAGRRTRTQYYAIRCRPRPIHLNRLPLEILLLIANSLPSTDAAAVQKATGSYLGDTYWRSRIPDVFYEVRGLSTESLNWEYLCLELERLKLRWTIFYCRRDYIWGNLDEMVRFIGDGTNNA